ncbi:thioredoxin fold domain-containing protein [Amphritea pacifica]|uniref:Thiol:disulfide interchange protein n=1 Tax=Amphritea pacifica TaxID=2811233 RepID=A0ABS2W3U4_9GAMM|nr:thioredoxin fold domain-containing protein [Amphritea pacifica]MBN0986373.1 thioredoxin fold domain-containing protein [Amphritea pacifica]MBN1007066.1 thioredoxin fold domain-containing protein [Amphritea pacifica]
MRKIFFTLVAMTLLSFNASADESKEAAIRAALSSLNSQVPIVAVADAQFPGLYEVTLASGEKLYVNESGSHFIVGEVYKVQADGRLVNLTEEGKKAGRIEQLAAIAPEDMIIFPAKGETRAHMTVFTDTDCFYCRKLHKEMAQINAQGIEVRYLAFPRAGAGSKTQKVMDSIWCADKADQAELFTQAKSGRTIPALSCDNSPVMSQYELGQKMGVTGTPALVLQDGTLVPGYMPAAQLAKMLGVAN